MSQISGFPLIVDPAVYRDAKWGLQPPVPDENIKKAGFRQPFDATQRATIGVRNPMSLEPLVAARVD